MRALFEIMERQNPESPLSVDESRVCVDLRETMFEAKIHQYRLNEEDIGVTDDLQVTAKRMS